MYRKIKNRLKGRKKVKNEFGHSETDLGGYHHSLSNFIEMLRKGNEDLGLVIWKETIGWEPHIKLFWGKPQSFSPQEAADYIERRNLLSDVWNYFESRWQVFSDRGQEQHYFDINIYGYPSGIYCQYFMPEKKLKHKITIDYLVSKDKTR